MSNSSNSPYPSNPLLFSPAMTGQSAPSKIDTDSTKNQPPGIFQSIKISQQQSTTQPQQPQQPQQQQLLQQNINTNNTNNNTTNNNNQLVYGQLPSNLAQSVATLQQIQNQQKYQNSQTQPYFQSHLSSNGIQSLFSPSTSNNLSTSTLQPMASYQQGQTNNNNLTLLISPPQQSLSLTTNQQSNMNQTPPTTLDQQSPYIVQTPQQHQLPSQTNKQHPQQQQLQQQPQTRHQVEKATTRQQSFAQQQIDDDRNKQQRTRYRTTNHRHNNNNDDDDDDNDGNNNDDDDDDDSDELSTTTTTTTRSAYKRTKPNPQLTRNNSSSSGYGTRHSGRSNSNAINYSAEDSISTSGDHVISYPPADGTYLALLPVPELIERVKAVLIRDNLKQKDLALYVGISGSTLSPLLKHKYMHTKVQHLQTLIDWVLARDREFITMVNSRIRLLGLDTKQILTKLNLTQQQWVSWLKLEHINKDRSIVDTDIGYLISALSQSRMAANNDDNNNSNNNNHDLSQLPYQQIDFTGDNLNNNNTMGNNITPSTSNLTNNTTTPNNNNNSTNNGILLGAEDDIPDNSIDQFFTPVGGNEFDTNNINNNPNILKERLVSDAFPSLSRNLLRSVVRIIGNLECRDPDSIASRKLSGRLSSSGGKSGGKGGSKREGKS